MATTRATTQVGINRLPGPHHAAGVEHNAATCCAAPAICTPRRSGRSPAAGAEKATRVARCQSFLAEVASNLQRVDSVEAALAELKRTQAPLDASRISVPDHQLRFNSDVIFGYDCCAEKLLGWSDDDIRWWRQEHAWQSWVDSIDFKLACTSMIPFRSTFLRNPPNDTAQLALYEKFADRHFSEALLVPVHFAGGTSSVVWVLDSERYDQDLFSNLWVHLLGVSYSFYDAVWRLVPAAVPTASVLTPRERECLFWLARGKTYSEIGIILGISHYTAIDYLDRAGKKLEVRGKAGLISAAVMLGLGADMDSGEDLSRRQCGPLRHRN